MALVLSKNPALLDLQPLAKEAEALDPPVVNTYGPEVEKWRRQVWDQMPPALKQRPDAATLLDKALYAMHYESSGNESSVGDGGAAWGLFQSHHIPSGSDSRTQIDDMWRMVSNNPNQWTDWGEGATYEGKPFGAFGNHPYGGGTGQTYNSSAGAVGNSAFNTLPTTQNKPTINFVSDKSAADTPDYVQNQGEIKFQNGDITKPYSTTQGGGIGGLSGTRLLSDVNTQTGGVDAQYGPFDTRTGQDFVDAPTNSPRALLEAKRQGQDQLGNAALAGATALPFIAGGLPGLAATAAFEGGRAAEDKLGLPTANLPIIGEVGPLSAGASLLAGKYAPEGEGLVDNPSRVPVKPKLRTVQAGETPGVLSAVDPRKQYQDLKAAGYDDATIAATFGEDAVRSGQAGENLGVAENAARIEAPGKSAKQAYEWAISEGKTAEEAKKLAAQAASPSSQYANTITRWSEKQLLDERRYLEDVILQAQDDISAGKNIRAEGLRANLRDLETVNRELQSRGSKYMPGSSVVPEGTPGQTTDSALAQEADRLTGGGGIPSERDQRLADIARTAKIAGDPAGEIRRQLQQGGQNQIKSAVEEAGNQKEQENKSALERAIQAAQNPAESLGLDNPQLAPPEQPSLFSDVLQQAMKPTEGPGELNIPPTSDLTPAGRSVLSQAKAAGEFERSQNVARQNIEQAARTPMSPAGEGEAYDAATKLRPDQQTALRGFDWQPGKNIAQTTASVVSDLISLPRALQTRFDFSYPFRQGLLFVRRQKEFWDSFGAGFRSMWDDDFANQVENAYTNAPYNPKTLKLTKWENGAGLQDREEAFYNRLVDKIPYLGKLFQASERGATIFINKLRSDVTNNVARKWLREGLQATDPQFIDSLERFGNYVNRATGYGNLGELEKAVGALNQVFYGARRNISLVQAPGYLFNTNPLVRKEAMKDFLGLFALGSSTLALAQLAGIGDVNTFNPTSADWGKLKIGNTRLDIWGGYQQMARTVWKIADGQIKDPGDLSSFWQAVLPFLGNKLSPQAGAVVSQMPEGIRTSLQPTDRNPFKLTDSLAPLAWQGLVDAIRDDGALGAAIGVTGLFGTGVQTYESKTDARDKVAQQLFNQKYEDLRPQQQGEVNRSEYVQNYIKENPTPYDRAKEEAFRDINNEEKQAEQAFLDGKLTQPLPELWKALDARRREESKALSRQFSEEFKNFDQNKYQEAVDGYYKINPLNPDGTPDFDGTELERQNYIKSLPEDQQQWLAESLQATRESKSLMHQKYLNYIDDRKKAGYFDPQLQQFPEAQRNQKLAELDSKNPELDALNWVWKGGVAGRESPRLNSKEGVDIALSLAPNRPVNYTGLARPVNQDPGKIEAWKAYGTRIDNYFRNTVPKYADQIAKDLYDTNYNNLDLAKQQAVSGRILQMVRAGSPELEAALQYFGNSPDGNGDYVVSAEALPYLQKMLQQYGNQPVNANNKSGRPSQFLVRR